jgi:hypothetical protein
MQSMYFKNTAELDNFTIKFTHYEKATKFEKISNLF